MRAELDRSQGQLACPRCGSTFIVYLRDPQSGEVVRAKRNKDLAICEMCKHIFEVEPSPYARIKQESVGDRIDDDRTCKKCGYNLRTLKVGARCPECGRRIVPVVLRNMPQKDVHSQWHIWDWLSVVVFILMVSTGYFLRNNQNHSGAIVFAGIGLIAILHGWKGLSLGSIKVGEWPFNEIKTGWSARIRSILFILLGIALMTFFSLYLTGFIK